MGQSIGSQGVLLLGKETTYGTPVTPSRAYPFTTEGLDRGQARDITKAMRGDFPRFAQASQQQLGKRDARGPIGIECNNKGLGYLLKATLGASAISQPSAGPDPTVYEQLYTPAASLAAEMHTVEVGWFDLAANPFSKTLVSAMVDKGTFSVKTDELATAAFDLIGTDLTVATAKTAPSYAAGLKPFSWAGATVTLGGVTPDAMSCDIMIDNKLDADRFYLGSAGKRKQPLAPQGEVTAKFDAEFVDWTAYNRVISNTFVPLVVSLVGDTISNAYKYELKFTLNVRTDGEPPKLTGPGRISEPLNLVAMDDGSGPASVLTVLYRTTDSAP